MIKKYKAPWALSGRGYIFIYKFPKAMKKQKHFTPDFAENSNFSNFGTLMLVDYENSTAGPYSELLLIPGKISFNNIKMHTISKIYVSTKESVINGRENWGIPKELAEFRFTRKANGEERITVTVDNHTIFVADIEKKRFSFPLNTKFFPIRLVQKMNNTIYFTGFRGNGKGHPARLKSLTIDPDYFPDISTAKPIAGVGISGLSLEFPVAEIMPAW